MKSRVFKNESIWIVVAHRAEARIYSCLFYDKKLTLVETLENPSGRLTNTELDRDGPHMRDGFDGAGKYATEPQHDSVSQVQWAFSRQIADKINSGRVSHKFEKLILVAPAKLLGDIQKNLSSESAKLVSTTHSKNLYGAEAQDNQKFETSLQELVAWQAVRS